MPEHDFALPHERHVLDNGLEVVLHRDTSAPVVAVYVYYHVGSSREEAGKTGFAHLFEHMLFQGSAHVPDNDHFRLIQEAGGTLNGTTNQDRTNYFETLPSNQLELALWLESDRMGFLLPAMTQAKLDNQRDVVMNERRQSYENRPYGLVHETALGLLYPPGHPYSWPTIGSMKDIGEATLKDVASFFRRWYGAGNATLAVGGDIDPGRALALVETYFGEIPRGPVVDDPATAGVGFSEARRAVLEDSVQLPQLTLAWPCVEAWHADEPALTLLADVLSANRSSILDAALMEEEELASLVTIALSARERTGEFTINLRPNPGVSLDTLEERVDELIRVFAQPAREGAASREADGRLERLKTRREGSVLRSLETVAGRTNQLAFDNCFGGVPDRIAERLERWRAVSVADLRRVANDYLVDAGRAVVSVVPRGTGAGPPLGAASFVADTAPSPGADPGSDDPPHVGAKAAREPAASGALDRSRCPEPKAQATFRSPPLWSVRLENAVELAGTPFSKIPVSLVSLAIPAGRLHETEATAGLSALAAAMLEEGTQSVGGTELVDALDGMGAEFGVHATDDEIVLYVSALDEHLASATELLTDVVLAPRFDADDFERVRRQQIVSAETRLDQPASLARDAYARLVYGPGVRGGPVLGTRETLERLQLTDVERFFAQAADPSATRLAFAGHADADAAARLFERLGAEWGGGTHATRMGPLDADSIGAPTFAEETTIYLVDKPGAQQSELRIGHGGLSRSDPDWFPAYVMNYVIGGSFSSRLNLNLREDKGYTYGVRSAFSGGRTPGSFTVSTAVQTDVTAAAIGEALKELRGAPGDIRSSEVEFARSAISQALRRAFESASALLGFVETTSKYDRPVDFPERRLAWLEQMDARVLNELAERLVRPENAFVVVVGDAEALEGTLDGIAPVVRGPLER